MMGLRNGAESGRNKDKEIEKEKELFISGLT